MTVQNTTVDADLFNSLGEAIKFVAERGGGCVHTTLWNTEFAKMFEADCAKGRVELRAPRPPAEG